MASRKPLVIIAGQVQNLPAGDTLNVPITTGSVVQLTNDEAAPVVICAPIYIDANDGFKKAKADAAGTQNVQGLVSQSPSIANGVAGQVQLNGTLVATTAQWDAVTGQVGGLTFNTTYYLDPATSGKLTTVAPTTAGQYVKPVGTGMSTTEMNINPEPSILL